MTENVVELHHWGYQVDMGCGNSDQWRLGGRPVGHPHVKDFAFVYVSTPVWFDRETMRMKTASGRTYQLYECSGKLEDQIEHILNDIKNKGTETW